MSTPLLAKAIRKIIKLSPLRWHIPYGVMRVEVIQRAINSLGAKRYLEIGVWHGDCFCKLTAPEKIGIDPIPPSDAVSVETGKQGVRYFALTSDEFFQQAAPQVLAAGVDVVFIDGLHTYAQAYRDCINSLKYLNQGGVILLHDCLPASEQDARVAQSYAEAIKLNSGTKWDGDWLGDVWKAIVRLRAQHPDLQTCVLRCDHGIGVAYRARNDSGLSYSVENIDAMTYNDLVKDTTRLLGLRKPMDLMALLEKLRLEQR